MAEGKVLFALTLVATVAVAARWKPPVLKPLHVWSAHSGQETFEVPSEEYVAGLWR
jgi:hypothetical protein